MECVYEEDKELVMQMWKTLEKGVPVTFEMRWKPKEIHEKGNPQCNMRCKPVWVSAACVPFMTDERELVSIFGLTTDITAQKQSQQNNLEREAAVERAEASENRFTRFMQLAPAAVWILDHNYKVSHQSKV
jgi:PAS domain-containing protein